MTAGADCKQLHASLERKTCSEGTRASLASQLAPWRL